MTSEKMRIKKGMCSGKQSSWCKRTEIWWVQALWGQRWTVVEEDKLLEVWKELCDKISYKKFS